MVLMMTDEPKTEVLAEVDFLKKSEDEAVDELVDAELDNIQLKAVNRMLVSSLWEALELRGLMLALQDPLALDSQKKEYRERWKKIELGIRAAIERADGLIKETRK